VSVEEPPGQDAAAQAVPAAYTRHAPLPSHAPSVPQLAAPWSTQRPAGSVPPVAMFEQRPRVPESTQERHVPVQASSQQTPCAQNPETHSAPSAQVLPKPLSPHEPFVHTAGAAQSRSPVHAALQTLPPHWKGKHELAAGVTQAPLPSHVEPGVNVVVPGRQLEPAHAVPCEYFWQVPPWHLPVRPQLAGPLSTQISAGSGAPFGTARHVPRVPGNAHDEHAPEQADSQQTPCAQNPVWHSAASEHEAPRIFLPHELPLQTLGETQFASAVQALKQVLPLHVYGAHGSESGGAHCPVAVHVEAGV
jgi:hypothetical protein